MIPHVLSIAGSDPSGGAGIQADLKTFSALGAYGCAVLTSLTAQSTRGVTGVHVVPAPFVREQVETLVDDVRIDAAKIGMVASAEVAAVVNELVRDRFTCPVILDPVMVSTAGSRLLDEGAVARVRELALAADLVTPNLPEAAVLLADDEPEARTIDEMRSQAQRLVDRGVSRVLVKGGHGTDDESVDVFHDGATLHLLRAPRVPTRNTHGTGCSLSSAITALVPQRSTWLEAVSDAKDWLTSALRRADDLSIGAGPGPVHHFHELWSTQ